MDSLGAVEVVGGVAGGGEQGGGVGGHMAALADAGDVETAALGLGIQDQLGGGLVLLRTAGLQKGIEFGLCGGKEIGYRLFALRFQHNDSPYG